tara:strand:+ start:3371 stop:3934 length:564 start_codon:yes stop_codon:yes gene_type:complete
MKWIGNRISFQEDKQKATFIVYPEKKPLITSLMGAWVAMWLAIGITMAWAYFTLELTQQEQIITLVFLAFWFYYAQRVGRSFLWLLYGKEMLKINEVGLVIKTATGSYGKAKEYFHENITKMQIHQPKEHSMQAVWENSPWVAGGERIEFEYKGKLIRFGRKLDEKDAKMLFQMIIKRVESQVRKSK